MSPFWMQLGLAGRGRGDRVPDGDEQAFVDGEASEIPVYEELSPWFRLGHF
jgi:hypothetical protein